MERGRAAMSAIANIQGGNGYPDLNGIATFEQTDWGTLVTVEVERLPTGAACSGGIFALHIHEGERCTGTPGDAFADARSHYNPAGCPHPYHAGDLPPLIGNNGYAYMSVLTDRFTVHEIIGRVIVIHEGRDDFTTQPSGNAGTKIGCGVIVGV